MLTSRISLRAGIVITLLLAVTLSAFAQQTDQAWVESYLRYFNFESKLSAQETARLAELHGKLYAPATSLEDRQAALKEAAMLIFRVAGTSPMPPEAFFTRFSQTNGQAVHRVITDPNSKTVTGATPLGQLGVVEKRGKASTSLLLLADIRTDWTLYQNFIERHADKYTMYVVTLPGYGGTPAPPRPASLDLTKTPWLDSAEKGIVALIEKEKIKPVVIGASGSAHLAARLALHHPDKLRAAVLLDGTVYTPFRSPANPDHPATLAERPKAMATQPGTTGMIAELLPALVASREATEARIKALPPLQLGQFFGGLHDLERARTLAISAAINSDPRAYRYNVEIFASDLSEQFKDLKIPVLAIPAIHDDNSPGQGGPAPSQWHELKMKHPTIPLTVVPFEATRAYIFDDAPKEFDKALESFIAGKTVEGKKGSEIALRQSPRGYAAQQIGATKISITYGRPQVNKRAVWGQLVPYNRLWRAGANEATYVNFSTDVLIEGQKLAAGSYALFTIPTESEWTVIFNKVPGQWGHFYYNPQFDALQVKVKPQTAEHEEWLSYTFDLLSPSATNIILRWEKVKAPIKVELEPAKPVASGN